MGAGCFDAGKGFAGIVMCEIVVQSDVALAWNVRAAVSRMPVGIGNVPQNVQKGQICQ